MSAGGRVAITVLVAACAFTGVVSDVTLASEGRIIYMVPNGIYEALLPSGTKYRVVKFEKECLGRGVAYDSLSRGFLWACDDRRLYYTNMSVDNPRIFDLTVTSTALARYLKTGITCSGEGTCYYSEFRDVGWRVYSVDMMKGENGRQVFSLQADQDTGGGLTFHDGLPFLSYQTDQVGHLAYPVGVSYMSVEHVQDAWISAWPIGMPTSLGSLLLLPMIKEGLETWLYKVDVTDQSPLELQRIPLPKYDTYQSTGTAIGNRQPGVVLVTDTVVAYSEDAKIYLATFGGDGTDKELLFDLGSPDIGSMFYLPPGDTYAPTQAPPTPVPPTPAPPTQAPPTAAPPTYVPTVTPTRSPVVWVETPFENPGNDGTIADETDAPPTPEEQALMAEQEAKENSPWPFGEGSKFPFLVTLLGLSVCGMGLIVYLAIRPAFAEPLAPISSQSEPEATDKLYREMNDTHSDPATDKHDAQSLVSSATTPVPKPAPKPV
eukprot:gene19374-29837_t